MLEVSLHLFFPPSHFDVVRSVAFHPTDQVVLTGSEDCTLKLWNIQRARQKSRDPRRYKYTLQHWCILIPECMCVHPRSLLVDVESLYTFRGHRYVCSGTKSLAVLMFPLFPFLPSFPPFFRAPVLSVAFGLGGDICFSGSSDSTIRVWCIPGDLEDDPFGIYGNALNLRHFCRLLSHFLPSLHADPNTHHGVLAGHKDAVWDLGVHPTTGYLLSCSADGSCRLWNHHQVNPLVREFLTESSE